MNGKIVFVVLLLVAGVAAYFLYDSVSSDWGQQPQPEPVFREPAPEQKPEPVMRPRPVLPEREPQDEEDLAEVPADEPAQPDLLPPPETLDDSDEHARAAVADFSERMVHWLVPDEQIRKWTVAVDQISEGLLPIKHRPADYRVDRFLVIEQDEGFIADGGNYQRWNTLVNVVTAIDPALLARYYQRWLPSFERAYQELGKPGNFDRRFRQTLDNVLMAPPVPENARLVRPHVMYRYADPQLEGASSFTKWLWRLGPENLEKLQHFARELRGELS